MSCVVNDENEAKAIIDKVLKSSFAKTDQHTSANRMIFDFSSLFLTISLSPSRSTALSLPHFLSITLYHSLKLRLVSFYTIFVWLSVPHSLCVIWFRASKLKNYSLVFLFFFLFSLFARILWQILGWPFLWHRTFWIIASWIAVWQYSGSIILGQRQK